jgi:hypothetical protein
MAIANIVLPDAAGTPVNHTFVFGKNDGDTVRWNEKTASFPSGYWPLSVSLRDPAGSNGSRVYRGGIDLAMPVSVTEVINGVSIPKVAYTLRAKVEFIFPADSSTQNRKDLLKILEKALAETQINGVLTTLDRLSG